MAQGQASSGMREPAPVRICPFCDAPFTARMTAWMGDPQPCACCNGSIMSHWPLKAPVRDTPELACDSCGKVLYRAA